MLTRPPMPPPIPPSVDKLSEPPRDFGQQIVVTGPTGWRALVLPVLGGLAFGAYVLMLIVGKSPWQ